MKNCLLCKHCSDDSESIEGYPINPYYICSEREVEEDKRFPYKNTTCKSYENDTDIISLTVKQIPKEVFKLISWKID